MLKVIKKENQSDLVNHAILAEPDRAQALVRAHIDGWNFEPGQLDAAGLPLTGQLPRPTRRRQSPV